MQFENDQPSPALAFLQAARDAMPSTIAERVRVQAMSEAMAIALRCRFKFHKDDANALQRLRIETSVGVFRPLNYYRQACIHGGTYARLWEQYHGVRPWIAEHAFYTDRDDGGRFKFLKSNRVCAGMGVLIPGSISEDELDLPRHNGAQVWWCTSADADHIVLCRYRAEGDTPSPFVKTGSPVHKGAFNRDEWAALQAAIAASEYDPEGPAPWRRPTLRP